MLDPVDRRYIAMRMINNLRGIYFARQEPEKALRVLDLLIAAAPDSADEHKQRAVALLQQHRMQEALGAFKRYLELSPRGAGPGAGRRADSQHRFLAGIAKLVAPAIDLGDPAPETQQAPTKNSTRMTARGTIRFGAWPPGG